MPSDQIRYVAFPAGSRSSVSARHRSSTAHSASVSKQVTEDSRPGSQGYVPPPRRLLRWSRARRSPAAPAPPAPDPAPRATPTLGGPGWGSPRPGPRPTTANRTRGRTPATAGAPSSDPRPTRTRCRRAAPHWRSPRGREQHSQAHPALPSADERQSRTFNRTLVDEWAYLRPYTSNDQRTAAVADFLYAYNYHRCHTSLGGRPPITRVNNPAVDTPRRDRLPATGSFALFRGVGRLRAEGCAASASEHVTVLSPPPVCPHWPDRSSGTPANLALHYLAVASDDADL